SGGWRGTASASSVPGHALGPRAEADTRLAVRRVAGVREPLRAPAGLCPASSVSPTGACGGCSAGYGVGVVWAGEATGALTVRAVAGGDGTVELRRRAAHR
ncbi:hypothetical protein, partial [Streptomyces carpinensis]|uniref:hypothetical protein n=1 Tax=Streptomyces carpinensis TaxID=66369 RepID=UPI001ABFE711